MNNTPSLINELVSQGRVLLQGRVLPPGKLDQNTLDAVKRDFNSWVDGHGIFNEQIAREIDYSPSIIGQWRKGAYPGDVEKVTRRLNDWMETDARRRRATVPVHYIETGAAEAMRGVIVAGCSLNSMVAIVAPSGSGKTLVLKAMAEKMIGVYHYCQEDTKKAFLQELATAAGINGKYHSAASSKRWLVNKLKGTRRPLFLDEAHRLRTDVIGVVRSLHDQAGVPIIMAGASEILHLIDDTAHGGGQFHSRTLQLNLLSNYLDHAGPDNPEGSPQAARAAARPLFTIEEVRQLFNGMAIRFDGDALELLAAVACVPGRGCLRTVQRVVELLAKQDPTRTITRRNVMEALSLLFSDAGVHLARLAQRHCEQARQVAG